MQCICFPVALLGARGHHAHSVVAGQGHFNETRPKRLKAVWKVTLWCSKPVKMIAQIS